MTWLIIIINIIIEKLPVIKQIEIEWSAAHTETLDLLNQQGLIYSALYAGNYTGIFSLVCLRNLIISVTLLSKDI